MNDKKSHHFVCIQSGTYKNHTVFHRFYCQLRHFCATNVHVYLARIIYIVFDNNANLKKGILNARPYSFKEKLNKVLECWIKTCIKSITQYMLWYDFID